MKKLSVIMPVYNEEETVAKAIDRSLSVDLDGIDIEVVVVDDGSDDESPEILKRYSDNDGVKVFTHAENQGKGMAIRTALEHVSGDMVIIEDADLELDSFEYPNLIKPILEDRADVVFGSRFKGSVQNMHWANWLANRILSFVTSVLYFKRVSDEATCYKVFRTEIIKSFDLQCTGFEFCPEVTAKALKNGYRYTEVPIHFYGRTVHGGKKIRTWDAFVAIYTLLKYRFRD